MGHMIEGIYRAQDDLLQALPTGEWERSRSSVRNWITLEGGAGPSGEGGFGAQAGRYHLYAAWNCPWAHRALLVRIFKRLEGLISISVALPKRTDQGWVYDKSGQYSDPLLQVSALHEVYSRDPQPYTGRLTVPVLWDKKNGRMVSNESADIIRMLNGAFIQLATASPDLYPPESAGQIDHWNALIYSTLNNGVYRAGFSSTQSAYEKAAGEVFDTLELIDRHLSTSQFLAGENFSEADIRLFTTLVRFDVAYHYAFKCNLKRIADYKNLWPYARHIYQMESVADTVHFDIYKRGYFSKSEKRNPLGIIPIGPQIDWHEPHNRT